MAQERVYQISRLGLWSMKGTPLFTPHQINPPTPSWVLTGLCLPCSPIFVLFWIQIAHIPIEKIINDCFSENFWFVYGILKTFSITVDCNVTAKTSFSYYITVFVWINTAATYLISRMTTTIIFIILVCKNNHKGEKQTKKAKLMNHFFLFT